MPFPALSRSEFPFGAACHSRVRFRVAPVRRFTPRQTLDFELLHPLLSPPTRPPKGPRFDLIVTKGHTVLSTRYCSELAVPSSQLHLILLLFFPSLSPSLRPHAHIPLIPGRSAKARRTRKRHNWGTCRRKCRGAAACHHAGGAAGAIGAARGVAAGAAVGSADGGDDGLHFCGAVSR